MSGVETRHPAKGEIWRDEFGTVRVMAVVEGYVVFRRKGAHPILCFCNTFGWYQSWSAKARTAQNSRYFYTTTTRNFEGLKSIGQLRKIIEAITG